MAFWIKETVPGHQVVRSSLTYHSLTMTLVSFNRLNPSFYATGNVEVVMWKKTRLFVVESRF
jgi:hypothetical protein